jgi:hypothetical protein
MVESMLWPRLRWRMRGAWQWPTFAVAFVADALLVTHLPFHGDGPDTPGALLLSGFFNLLAVALGAPLLGMLVRRRRPDLPRLIARDYAGTFLLALVTAALLAGGLIHRPQRLGEQRAREAAMAAVHDYVLASAPAFKSGLTAPDLVKEDNGLYRVCVWGREPLPLCLYVTTSQHPAGVTRDPSREPNRHN